jgi:GDP-L-fucose synthase
MNSNSNSKILVVGRNGLVGSAVIRRLQKQGYTNILSPSKGDLNALNPIECNMYFDEKRPEYVFLCAAKVGGIVANDTYPVQFFADNVSMGINILRSANKYEVKKLINLGTTCMYPRDCEQPINESSLLTGSLESTNEAYALAKISILRLCEYYNKQYKTNFITACPTNIYGINDNYHPQNSHVLPAIIRKVIEAKRNRKTEIDAWGDGSAVRDFIYSDDVADALIHLCKEYNGKDGAVNIGWGEEHSYSIKDTYELALKAIGHEATINWDESKPNGTPVKVTDSSKMTSLGWSPSVKLEEGIKRVYGVLRNNDYKYKEQ